MNIFSKPERQSDERIDILYVSNNARVERIVSQGHVSPEGFWLNQNEDELVILAQGSARIQYDPDYEITLEAGDSLLIPAQRKHRVTYTSTEPPCVWICVFSKK